MSDLSDPSGAGRGDRKKARSLIDAAYAAGRITAADRAFRIERVDAAATKGDLAGLTADLGVPAPQRPVVSPPTTSVPPPPAGAPQQPWPQQPTIPVRPGGQPPLSSPGLTPQQTKGLKRGIGCVVAIVAASVLVPCVIGIITIIISVFTGGFEFSTSSNDLDSRDGWSSFVDDVRDENGSTEVERVRFDDSIATIWVTTPTGEAKQTTWRNGVFDSSQIRTTTVAGGATFDLATATEVLADVRDRAVERSGVADPRSVQADVTAAGIDVTVIAETGQISLQRYTLTGEER